MSGPTTPGPTVGRQAGFTLIEMVVVLAILALALAIALPWSRKSAEAGRIESVATEVSAYLRLARTRAIASNDEVTVGLDLDGRRVRMAGWPRSIELPAHLAVELTAARRELRGRQAAIRFYPDGSSTGGVIRLRDDRKDIHLRVNWLTGLVDKRSDNDGGACE